MFELVPASIAAGLPSLTPALAIVGVQSLAHLSWLDLAVIAIYFVMVIWIGFYLKGQANTSEEFFMAGREMTAWIAGLSFVSANLGSLELMGWAGSSYQYGILAAHWYWIGAIPAMLFLGMVMMPFYYVCKTHSVPGYLKLRYGQGSSFVAAVSFAFMTVLMSGVNMFAMAEVMKIVLGWDLNFSIIVSSLAVAAYVALGGLRSAIFNEVLQFVLIWGGAMLVPILGLIETGGWSGFKARLAQNIATGEVLGGDEAEAGDPGGHFAAGHEELFAGVGLAFEVEADPDHHDEVDGDYGDVERAKMREGRRPEREGRGSKGMEAGCGEGGRDHLEHCVT